MSSENTNTLAPEEKNKIVTTSVAVDKIADELKNFKGDNKATAVSKFVASTLTHFCEQSEKFAVVVGKTPRTLSECCAEIMSGVGSSISDIDVYRAAVKHYFPDAEVHMNMEIVTGANPTEEQINRAAEKKPAAPRQKKEAPAKPQNTQTKAPEAPKKETIQLSLF